MSVIRTLSASETNEQREKERAKLEKEYKKSDARLDELVAANAQEITEVMEVISPTLIIFFLIFLFIYFWFLCNSYLLLLSECRVQSLHNQYVCERARARG